MNYTESPKNEKSGVTSRLFCAQKYESFEVQPAKGQAIKQLMRCMQKSRKFIPFSNTNHLQICEF